MTTTTHPDPMSNGRAEEQPRTWSRRGGKSGALRLSNIGRRRRVPHLVLGLVLVVACTIGGVVLGTQLGNQEQALALARPVTVGQVLSSQDIRQVSVSAGNELGVISAAELSTVVGQTVAFSLPAGALLTRDTLGAPQVPPQGQAVVAVAVKPGQFPPDLSAGTRLAVMVTPASNATGATAPSAPLSWSATVTGVHTTPNDQNTVVALLLSETDARQFASVSVGQINLVAVNGGGR